MIAFQAIRGVIFTKSDEQSCHYHYACPYCGWIQEDVTLTKTESYKGNCKCPDCWIRFKVEIRKIHIKSPEQAHKEIHKIELQEIHKTEPQEKRQASFWGRVILFFKGIFA
ncbi:hypothetical protein CLI91_09490 [Lentilactobacillus hilgardii]|uniref:hypothetical protein n=1 Tax=Lentilactobacillus hilgardii TaxID=1588 RepID=UPI001DFE3CE3|nr:hypothetical protein [Lentilactobacillus hilgardii]MBZ2204491.1 hypothetical protein [Lentilactobacillus hilgardii]